MPLKTRKSTEKTCSFCVKFCVNTVNGTGEEEEFRCKFYVKQSYKCADSAKKNNFSKNPKSVNNENDQDISFNLICLVSASRV